MKPLYDGHESYYKKMLDLQEQLRKSEEERIRLEERFNLLVRESRNRHQECINRLRMRYVEYLEEQRMRDERNNRILGNLDKIDTSLALMNAKTERLNNLRKQYEAYLLRTYGNQQQRPSGSVTADSGLESQHEQEIPPSPVFSATICKQSATKSPVNYRAISSSNDIMRTPEIPISNYNYKLPSFSWIAESSNEMTKKSILPSYLDTSYKLPTYEIKHEEKSDCLLKDFTIKPTIKTTTVDPVSTAERNLEQYLNQIKQMHKDVDKSAGEYEQSADEAEQNTSGDLLNVSLSEDNLEPSSVDEEAAKERLRLKFARQAFANPRLFSRSQDTTKTPPNSFDKTSSEPAPKPIEELTKSSPKFSESIISFRDRLRRSELINSRNKIDTPEPKIIEESTKFSETISPVKDKYELTSLQKPIEETPKMPTYSETMSSFKDRFKRLELSSSQNEPEPKPIEETTKLPTFSETMSTFKDRFKRTTDYANQPEVKEDTRKSPTFSESIGSLREKFNRTDFMSSCNKPITPDSFEDAFAKLTRMKEQPRRPEPQETPAPVITEELPTPPAEEEEEEEEGEKESSSEEPENDGIEDDYDDTVDIDSWMPDDVEPEPQEVKRKDDILDLPRRKLESIEEVEHAEDEEVEEDGKDEENRDVEDAVVIEEVKEEDEKENVELNDAQDVVEQAQVEEKVESLNVGYETQEQVADANATYEGQEQYADQQQYYEQDGTVKEQYQTGSEYYEQGDAQQYQYSDPNDPNQQYTYDPNAQYAGYEGQYAGYEQYQQYDPSQYDPSQYDPNQQYPQYTDQTYAAYQESDETAAATAQYNPNQAYDYSQAYATTGAEQQPIETYNQPTTAEELPIDLVEPSAPSQTTAAVTVVEEQAPKKKKDAIKAILDSDSESFIERNLSNTESDYDFN